MQAPNIDEVFKLKQDVFCDMKRMIGMVVLQKLGKALVHSGDVTLNVAYVPLKWERGGCIQVMIFLGGHVAQAARCLATSSTHRVSEGWKFSSLLRVQIAPGIHSAYYKMSTGG